MKLLRLVSPKSQGLTTSEWTNYFNDNFILKPQSKIGLLNASIPINNQNIVIDAANDTFEFKTADSADTNTVQLPNKTYDTQGFIDELTRSVHRKLNFRQPSDIGFHFATSVAEETDGNHIVLSIARNKAERMKTLTNANITISPDGNTISKTTTTTDDKSFLYSSLPMLFSCSYLRTSVVVRGTMRLGLTASFEGSLSFPDTLFKYAIGINGTGVNAKYVFQDETKNFVETSVGVNTQDVISLDIYGGRIWYNIYRGANLLTTLHSMPIDTLDKLNAVVVLIHPDVQCSLPQLIYDPRFKVIEDDIIFEEYSSQSYIYKHTEQLADSLGAIPSAPTTLTNSIFTLTFTDTGLREVMGFASGSIKYKGEYTTFKASSSVNELVLPKNLIVELQDLYLDTMDAGLGKRRNILAIIPQLTVRENNLIYECTSTPIMLDLFNAMEINLRSLRIRILTRSAENDVLIDISDQIELTLLLD
jgi:hypothetical protein